MNHLLSLLFAVVLSFGQGPSTTTHHADMFAPRADHVAAEVPVPNHEQSARYIGMNSYSEVACLSCRSTNATSQPQLILRAQR